MYRPSALPRERAQDRVRPVRRDFGFRAQVPFVFPPASDTSRGAAVFFFLLFLRIYVVLRNRRREEKYITATTTMMILIVSPRYSARQYIYQQYPHDTAAICSRSLSLRLRLFVSINIAIYIVIITSPLLLLRQSHYCRHFYVPKKQSVYVHAPTQYNTHTCTFSTHIRATQDGKEVGSFEG